MEDQLRNLKKLVEDYENLLRENKRIKEENEVLRKSIDNLENDLIICRREIKYIKQIRDRALKKLEKVLNEIKDID